MRKYVILAALVLAIISCEKQDLKEECIQEFITAKDLLRYEDQEISSQFYYELYENEGIFTFLMGHHYIDFLVSPSNCTGESLCDSPTDETCFSFLEDAQYHGIVAITKD